MIGICPWCKRRVWPWQRKRRVSRRYSLHFQCSVDVARLSLQSMQHYTAEDRAAAQREEGD